MSNERDLVRGIVLIVMGICSLIIIGVVVAAAFYY